jgi:hypothetical protein
MSSPLLRFVLPPVVLIATTGLASAAYRGYVEGAWGTSFCQQETHDLTDPCSGDPQWLLDDRGAIDMDGYLCSYVDVDGPDVGVTCQIFAPVSVLPASPPCRITFKGLWMDDAAPPALNWYRVTCAVSYDVIRGDLAAVRAESSQINLGPVTCLANDFPQANFWYVIGPADTQSPALGKAFFYLVRASGLPDGAMPYGYSSDGREEVPHAGDCPP